MEKKDVDALNMQTELDNANATIQELKQSNMDVNDLNEKLQAKIAELEEQLEAMAAAPGKAPAPVKKKPAVPEKSFKVDKTEYLFTVPQFSHSGSIITAEEALTNKDLLKELVEMGFGGIKPQPQP